MGLVKKLRQRNLEQNMDDNLDDTWIPLVLKKYRTLQNVQKNSKKQSLYMIKYSIEIVHFSHGSGLMSTDNIKGS